MIGPGVMRVAHNFHMGTMRIAHVAAIAREHVNHATGV